MILPSPVFTLVPACLRSVRTIHFLSTLGPGLKMCNLTCIVFVPVHVTWYCLVFESACFLTLRFGVASTTNHATLDFLLGGAPSVLSAADPGNQYILRFSSSFATFESFAHVLAVSPLAASLGNLHPIQLEPVTLLRCFATTQNRKTDICFVALDLKLVALEMRLIHSSIR